MIVSGEAEAERMKDEAAAFDWSVTCGVVGGGVHCGRAGCIVGRQTG